MAYVVTVHRRYGACTDPTHDHSYEEARRTVATLSDAQVAMRESVVDAALDYGTTQGFPPAHRPEWAAEMITEDGGTVGPLPDGTTVVVAVAGA